jgi:hypothetical protein
MAGDTNRFVGCLTDPLRWHCDGKCVGGEKTCELLREEMKDIKGWSQSVELEDERNALVTVDEVRTGGTRRVRYRLEQTNRGWLMAEIVDIKNVPTSVPFGTHISKVIESEQK